MALAFLVTFSLLESESKKAGLTAVDSGDILVCAMLGGIFGSKIHCVLSSGFSSLFSMAGFNFQGGAVLGTMSVCAFLKYNKQEISMYAEIILPLVPLGHAIGKLGCFFSGDGCYGTASNLPWAMSFPNGLVPITTFVHPTPLYEFTLGLCLWLLLQRVERRRAKLAVVGIGLSRLIIENWRPYPPIFWGLSEYQLFALVIIFSGLLIPEKVKRS